MVAAGVNGELLTVTEPFGTCKEKGEGIERKRLRGNHMSHVSKKRSSSTRPFCSNLANPKPNSEASRKGG